MEGTPSYGNISSKFYLLNCYENNPVVQSVINIKANALSNMRFSIRNLSDGEVTPLSEFDSDGGYIKRLLHNPNPLQSQTEWLRQFKINFEVFGNAYMYALLPIGFTKNFDYKNVQTLNNLHSSYVTPVLTGDWLTATDKKDIIKEYLFTSLNDKEQTLDTDAVFHLNNGNIRLDGNFTEGVSDLIALNAPISNIDIAFESRNTLGRNQGALGILTSEKKDEALGNIPLTDDEIDKVQHSMRKYGTQDGQYKHIITPMPLKYQKMALSTKELMLLEEVSHSTLAICNSKGVPEELLRNYIKTGSFNTDGNSAEKRLYDSTIIPESVEFINALNSFLNLNKHGYEILGTFDHVKCLQADRKKEAQVKKVTIEGAEKAFRLGAVPYSYVMNCMEIDVNDEIGDKYVWDLTEDERSAIGINGKTENNGQDGNDGNIGGED